MKATIQLPALYAVAGGLFLLSLPSFYMSFVNITHIIDADVDGSVPIIVLGILLAVACLCIGFIVLGIARARKSPPVTISLSPGKQGKQGKSGQRRIKISGRNFSLQFQLPATLTLWGISLGDVSADGITALGWVTFGLGFLTLALASYGFYSLISKPQEQLPTADSDPPPTA